MSKTIESLPNQLALSHTHLMTKDTQAEDAQARLDQLRHEAGGALSGREVRKRHGLDPNDTSDDPPLDWSATPLNITLQILAVALFIAVMWFIITSFFGGFSEVLSR